MSKDDHARLQAAMDLATLASSIAGPIAAELIRERPRERTSVEEDASRISINIATRIMHKAIDRYKKP